MSRPPNYEFQEWWNKQRDRERAATSAAQADDRHLLLPLDFDDAEATAPASAATSTSTSSSYSISVPFDSNADKSRSRSSRQTLHLLRLKVQSLASLAISLSHSFFGILRTAGRRILLLSSPRHPSFSSPSSSSSSRLYRVIKCFLALVVSLLIFEIVAYFKGWHFSPPRIGSQEVLGLVEWLYAAWVEVRVRYLAPQLQLLTNLCILLFLVQSVDRVVLVLGCVWIKLRGIKPKLVAEGELGGEEGFPMVLVQIPMCNEKEVRKM